MFEIDARGGLGRRGTWTRSGRTLSTPLVLFLHRSSRPAPTYAEALFVSERSEDPRFQVRVSGSFFAPRIGNHGDDLPPVKGMPLSMADLEVPADGVAGDLSILVGESDLATMINADAVFLANGPEFERSPREFVAAIRRLRESLGPAKVAAVTGLASPSNVSILVYAGVDVVDSSRMMLDSARGLFHTADGAVPVSEAERAACACPACTTGGDLQAHNDHALYRPEIVRFRRRIRERYRKPPSARILLLLPCSARKPYSASRSHRRFRDAILGSENPSVVHEVIVTSPLGLIPRELERFHPARDYDIPVTGDWSRDDAAIVIEDLSAFVATNRYDAVVAHLGAEAPIVQEAVPEAIFSTKDHPTSEDSLVALTRTLDQVAGSVRSVAKGARFAEEMSNLARFQFGETGSVLVEGATFRGRFPDVRVLRGTQQLAMHTARGMLSLTLAGGEVLSKKDAYWVEIEDFLPVGNIFAVGVRDAAHEIRPGDEVAVRHGSEVRAVGTARLGWREMKDLRRGEAVHVRHALERPP